MKSSIVDCLSSTAGMVKSSLVNRLSSKTGMVKSSLIDHLSSTTGMVKLLLERSQKRKHLRWRVRAEGGYGGKGQGRRCSKISSRSTIEEDEEMAQR